jgi:hypothetical protein
LTSKGGNSGASFPIVLHEQMSHLGQMIIHDGTYRPDGIDVGPALRQLKEGISVLSAQDVQADVEDHVQPAYAFAGFALAALDLSERTPIPKEEIVRLASRALDWRDQSKLTDGDNKCCELMLRMALLDAKVWKTVKDHFHDTLALKGHFAEFSAELHDAFEISRRMKMEKTWRPKKKQKNKEPFYQLGTVNISVDDS